MTEPTLIDLLIEPEWIIPIEPAGVTLQDHAVAVNNGRIAAILPRTNANTRFRARSTKKLPGEVLLPGLINLHTHAAMTLLRGYADDLPLMQWLQERIWPAEARHANTEFVEAGTFLACAEMLRGGITCFNDMYFFPQAAAAAARRAGIRVSLGIIVLDFPTAYANDADDYLAKGLAIRDACQSDPIISFCLAPHAPYTVSDRSFAKVATLAAQLELPIHVHIHETASEIAESLRTFGLRPLTRLHELGIVGPQLIAVHGVHLDAADIDLLAREGASVAHCPTSNLKLGSGIAPVTQLIASGVNLGLGTDGAASNNRLDMFHEMRHAALLAKGVSGNAAALTAHEALRAATLGGAKALGLDREIGSLLPGKVADLCSVRLDEWISQPCYDPASHLVYVAGREQVNNVWVAGKQRLSCGKLVEIPPDALIAVSRLWHTSLST